MAVIDFFSITVISRFEKSFISHAHLPGLRANKFGETVQTG
jgi:hypothetical protein